MNSLTDVWGSVLQQMSQQLAPTTINTWFDEVDVVTMEDSAFVLHCGNEFKKKTIETRFLSYIRDALRDLFSADLRSRSSTTISCPPITASNPTIRGTWRTPGRSPLRPM